MTWANAQRRVSAASVQALEAAAVVLEAASNDLVPDLTGALQASSRVTVDASRGVATVSYDTDYAVAVHEDLTASHDDGQAKWLETALNQNAPQLLRIMAGGVRRGLH